MARIQGATHKKDLRSGQSIWQARPARIPPSRPLTRDVRADVLVIGAGISGAMVAEQLTDLGLDVVIVDRRTPLTGSTPASTALLQYEIDEPLGKLSSRIGKGKAQQVWRRSILSLEALRARTRALGIRCDMGERDALLIEGDVLDADGLAAEAELRREIGLQVTFMPAREVKGRFGISGRAAILGYNNIAADPRRLAAGYLSVAVQRGARLYQRTEIAEIAPARSGVTATTASGPVITARHAIFCTGYEMPKGVPMKGHSIASTWAMATVPQKGKTWDGDVFIWEAADPYLYLRVGPGRRVICGGEDAAFEDEERRDALMETKIATIAAKLKKLMPWLDTTPEFRWCGNFGASATGTPSIGPVPRMPSCFAVLGYGGNGITFSMMAAQMLRTMIDGGTDPDAPLFSFSRR